MFKKLNKESLSYVLFGLILAASGLVLPSIDTDTPFWFCLLMSCLGTFLSVYALTTEYELDKHNKENS